MPGLTKKDDSMSKLSDASKKSMQSLVVGTGTPRSSGRVRIQKARPEEVNNAETKHCLLDKTITSSANSGVAAGEKTDKRGLSVQSFFDHFL